jgi:4-amino-4-deoxy-L-arabinose transferase-like glycosyltransferase
VSTLPARFAQLRAAFPMTRLHVLGLAIIALAIFNLTFRLANERVTEWDESLYAVTAFEMLQSHDWIATTSQGVLDYSNSKPPLNAWLLALSTQTFGAGLISLRLVSVIAALLTIIVLLAWASRRFGRMAGLWSALVLATCFGFLHVHSGRSANPDALLTLFLLLIVIVLDSAAAHPWRRLWLGPLLAGVFMLKGMAILLPLVLIAFMEWRWSLSPRRRWLPLLGALALALSLVAPWAIARWQIDRTAFFERIVFQDLVALSTTTLDDQGGSPFFYVNILQKHHYEWIAALLLVALLFPPTPLALAVKRLKFWATTDDRIAVVGAWATIALLIPTLMQTKLPWYLNPFYPMFALGVGCALAYGFARSRESPGRRRALIAMLVLATVVAESKLLYYSYAWRGLDTSAQAVMLLETDRLRGARVFRGAWDRADAFVLEFIVRGERAVTADVDDFVVRGTPDDYLVAEHDLNRRDLERVRRCGRYGLFRKRHHSERVVQ